MSLNSTAPIVEKKKFIFFILISLLASIVLVSLPRLSVPLIIAYIIYLIISPAILRLQKIGLRRRTSVFVVFLVFIIGAIYPVVKTVPIVINEAENIQYYLPKVENYLIKKSLVVQKELKEKVGYSLDEEYLPKLIDISRTKLTTFLLNLTNYLGPALEWIFLTPLVVFFLLRDGRKFKKSILSLVPNSLFERFYFLSDKFNTKLGNYIFAKFIEALFIGAFIWLGLVFLGVRFSLLLGLVAGLTNIIPYVGPIVGFTPALLFGLAEYGADANLGAIAVLYMVANIIDMAIVFPLLVSKVVDLHPMVVVVSVIIGGQWLGMVGMVISIPVAAAVKLIFEEVYKDLYLRG